jgi:hypothetical protein
LGIGRFTIVAARAAAGRAVDAHDAQAFFEDLLDVSQGYGVQRRRRRRNDSGPGSGCLGSEPAAHSSEELPPDLILSPVALPLGTVAMREGTIEGLG